MNYDDYQELSDEQAVEVYQEEQYEMNIDSDERLAEIAWQLFESQVYINTADIPYCP